jgi:hypothetical protein
MRYANVYVDEPLDKIVDDWDFLHEKVLPKFMGFRPVGDGVYGMRQILSEAPPTVEHQQASTGPVLAVKNRRHFEIGPQGLVTVKRTPLVAHVTLAGTPHHTEFVYGYWHINDMDEISVDVPPAAGRPGYVILIQGHPKGPECDRIAWYCEECHELVHMSELVTGNLGFRDFWSWERAAVRAYNEDPKLRTCWNCGHVNPLGYLAFATQDTPEERESRLKW